MSTENDGANPADDGAQADVQGAADETIDTADQTVDAEAGDQGEDQDGEAGDGQASDGQPEPEIEAFEFNGKTFNLPKEAVEAIKPHLMMEQDYRQKTMSLADQRRAVEARGQATEALEATYKALQPEYERIGQLRAKLDGFKEVDWGQAFAQAATQGPEAVAEVMAAQGLANTLTADLKAAEDALSTKTAEALQHRQAALSAAMQETSAVLAQEIPNWSPQVAGMIVETADQYGFTIDDMMEMTDPRAWKAFHALSSANKEIAALKAQLDKSKTTQRHAQSQSTTPAKSVTTKGGFKPGLDDGNDTKTWMERRNAQVRRA